MVLFQSILHRSVNLHPHKPILIAIKKRNHTHRVMDQILLVFVQIGALGIVVIHQVIGAELGGYAALVPNTRVRNYSERLGLSGLCKWIYDFRCAPNERHHVAIHRLWFFPKQPYCCCGCSYLQIQNLRASCAEYRPLCCH